MRVAFLNRVMSRRMNEFPESNAIATTTMIIVTLSLLFFLSSLYSSLPQTKAPEVCFFYHSSSYFSSISYHAKSVDSLITVCAHIACEKLIDTYGHRPMATIYIAIHL
jgi:hypothetical protein